MYAACVHCVLLCQQAQLLCMAIEVHTGMQTDTETYRHG